MLISFQEARDFIERRRMSFRMYNKFFEVIVYFFLRVLGFFSGREFPWN